MTPRGRQGASGKELSACEALNFGSMEVFVLLVMAVTLVRVCGQSGVGAGDIFAVFRYLLMFIMALNSVPLLVQQIGRLRDIRR